MKRYILVIIVLATLGFSYNSSEAQVLDGVYVKEHVPARKAVPYKFLREGDVMWSKRIWRVIDLNEKINQVLYYPTVRIGDRMSLIDLLIWGIETEGLTAYSTSDDRFTQPIGKPQIDEAFGAGTKIVTYPDENGNEVEKTIEKEVNTSEVKQLLIKEDWFFDRGYSTMDVRIIGICPVRFYIKESDGADGGDAETRIQPTFWVYFPEARRILANHEVFNEFNDAERKTFDDIFFKRKFNSLISKETNVHDDRAVSDYTLGLESLLEGEKIKKSMVDYEQDLWNY
jgi:gliding motility associated protien GldN